MIEDSRYNRLIEQEAKHWGEVRPDPANPQIWHDPKLFEIFFGKEYRHLIERTLDSGPKVLELGCGEGNLSLELAQNGLDVTAIDLSAERIDRAKSTLAELKTGSQVTFLVGDLNTINLEPRKFDCVVAHDSLHHILKLDRLLDEVQRTLKPEGRFITIDFIGMGALRKIAAAFLYGILPTFQPYGVKWNQRRRLPAFLASEQKKRKEIERGSTSALHQESPFEEISQRSIITEIQKRFAVLEFFTFNPFWYYFAAKIKVPGEKKYSLGKTFRQADNLLTQLHLSRGAYFFIEARLK
ncbi:MAG: class I SAM-dependent methyltransferase [Ignavibacteriales bacterium]|nr:class I SAM-dependent methyltransferase [Ignavibacteriales bacterium]